MITLGITILCTTQVYVCMPLSKALSHTRSQHLMFRMCFRDWCLLASARVRCLSLLRRSSSPLWTMHVASSGYLRHLEKHKLLFSSVKIPYTVFCACVRIMAKHKLVFSSVEILYTVHCAYSQTLAMIRTHAQKTVKCISMLRNASSRAVYSCTEDCLICDYASNHHFVHDPSMCACVEGCVVYVFTSKHQFMHFL